MPEQSAALSVSLGHWLSTWHDALILATSIGLGLDADSSAARTHCAVIRLKEMPDGIAPDILELDVSKCRIAPIDNDPIATNPGYRSTMARMVLDRPVDPDIVEILIHLECSYGFGGSLTREIQRADGAQTPLSTSQPPSRRSGPSWSAASLSCARSHRSRPKCLLSLRRSKTGPSGRRSSTRSCERPSRVRPRRTPR